MKPKLSRTTPPSRQKQIRYQKPSNLEKVEVQFSSDDEDLGIEEKEKNAKVEEPDDDDDKVNDDKDDDVEMQEKHLPQEKHKK